MCYTAYWLGAMALVVSLIKVTCSLQADPERRLSFIACIAFPVAYLEVSELHAAHDRIPAVDLMLCK